MTWISLVCLLVFAGSALGQAGYSSGYGAAPVAAQAPRLLKTIREQRPFLPVQTPTYGQQPILPQRHIAPIMQQDTSFLQHNLQGGYSSPLASRMALVRNLPSQGYGAVPFIPQQDQPLALPPTQADILCQGQAPETVIPLEDGRKFVVCLDTGKGTEQECPRGLYYQLEKRRCDRKSGAVDVCATQPCLNGGQCVPTEFSYQCQCVQGFDGQSCELDARVCQTQNPCGQAPDTKCQSFRLGAALQYICIFQDGLGYGLNAQQIIPSPCKDVDGPQALTVSNGGFIMCATDLMFVESCPGGTIWDDVEKACSWPDQQSVVTVDLQSKWMTKSPYGSQYGVPQQIDFLKPKVTYGSQYGVPPQLDIPKPTLSYGSQYGVPPQLDIPKPTVSYGVPPQLDIPKPTVSYGVPPQLDIPRPTVSYGVPPQLDIPKPTVSYGSPYSVPQQIERPKMIHSFNNDMLIRKQFDRPTFTPTSFGDQSKFIQHHKVDLNIPKQFDFPKPTVSYGGDQSKFIQHHQVDLNIPKQFDFPKPVESYGTQFPQQLEQVKMFREEHKDVAPVKSPYGY